MGGVLSLPRQDVSTDVKMNQAGDNLGTSPERVRRQIREACKSQCIFLGGQFYLEFVAIIISILKQTQQRRGVKHKISVDFHDQIRDF